MVTKTNLYKVTIIMRNRNLFHYRQGQSAKVQSALLWRAAWLQTQRWTDRQRERADERARASAEWLTRKPVQCPMRRKWV